MSAPSKPIKSTASSPSDDGFDLLDLSEYESGIAYQSPSLSPSVTNKIQFARPTPAIATTPATMPTTQMLCGPSHQYEQYKQQTPFVPGALANTLALNESSARIAGYNVDYINPGEEIFDFNAAVSHDPMTTPNMDIDFESPAESSFFFSPTNTINPHTANMTSPSMATQAAGIGRMYPGMHQQRAAMAKAQLMRQQQQQQQQQQEMLQHQNQQHRTPQNRQARPKALPTDPIVEQKIAQLLNSMRTKAGTSDDDDSPLLSIPRPKKEEDDMDEDERLLASEEGKKLSSKERRQLRNKVSARAFRSRRKEYIGHLESEIAAKVSENNDLRAANRALLEENKRITDLSKMLLASPQFSSFLEVLSSNPASLPHAQNQMEQRQPEPTQMPKDANPYHAVNTGQQQQQIGMVMMPEQRIDMSMLNLNTDGFYQPQVFAVLDTPELPQIDSDTLMGKSSNFVGGAHAVESDKTDSPSIETPVLPVIEKHQTSEMKAEPTSTDKPVSNLDGDIFDEESYSAPSAQPFELDTDGFSAVDIFGGIEAEKAFARYELVDSSEEDKLASMALHRVERLMSSLAPTIARLERMDISS